MRISNRHDLWVYAFNTYARPTVEKHGTINLQRLEEVAKGIGKPDLTDWDFYLPAKLQAANAKNDTELAFQAAYFFFVQTALQYCFWDFDEDGKQIHWCYKGNRKAKGSRGCVAMTIDMFNNGDFPGLHIKDRGQIMLRLEPYIRDMPHAESRMRTLLDVADIDTFHDHIYTPMMTNPGGVVDTVLAAKIAQFFPDAYADPFLKKAQLALGLIITNFRSRCANLKPSLTAYSDYRIPQVLRHLGLITYTPQLAVMVDNGFPIKSGSPEELAIRSLTILACARLAAESGLSDMEIDSWLFEQSRDPDFQQNAKPFHLTVTTHY